MDSAQSLFKSIQASWKKPGGRLLQIFVMPWISLTGAFKIFISGSVLAI
jgi:hypothetical protein